MAVLLVGCVPDGPGRGTGTRAPPRTIAAVAVPRAPLALTSSLRFSPRVNRAAEIHWRAFGEAAFVEARARHVPVFLSLSAVWCHWCHVLDETTLSDPRVLSRLEQFTVPVRVDADQRPDLERRYLLGGWPTIAFLDGAGRVVTGSSYMPADAFVTLFDRVAAAYARDAVHAADAFEADFAREGDDARPGELPTDLGTRVVADIIAHTDHVNGGAEGRPKFPDAFAVALLLRNHAVEPGAREAAIVTARGIERLADPVEGGFFRYATREDWSAPHLEKMTATNADLIELYANASRLAPRDLPNAEALTRRAIAWAHTTLRDDAHGWFAASQDADEAYYALPEAGRRARTAPFIDRTPIASLNARMARALLVAAEVLGDPALRDDALAALRFLREHMQRSDGAVFHAVVQGEPTLAGDLVDIAWVVRAFVRASAITAERNAWLAAARVAIEFAERALTAPSGGFYDRPARDEGTIALPGLLSRRWRDFELNATMALALAEFSLATGDRSRAALSRRTLAAFGGAWRTRRTHAPLFATAFEALVAAERALP